MPVMLPVSKLQFPVTNLAARFWTLAHSEGLQLRGPKHNHYIPGLGAPVLYMLPLLPLVDKRKDFGLSANIADVYSIANHLW